MEQDMTYIVVYQREDGSSGLEECADIDLAIVTAERLRNVDAVERPRIFKTSEVTYDFKPYYRVEVTTADSPEPVEATSASETVEQEPAAVAESQPAPVVDVDPVADESAEAEEELAAEAPDTKSSLAQKAEAAVAKAESAGSSNDASSDADAADSNSGSGLFDDRNTSDDVEFPAVTKEGTSPEATPPRRGLFGR